MREQLLLFLREINRFLKLLFEFAYLKTPCFLILASRNSNVSTRETRVSSFEDRVETVNLLLSGTVKSNCVVFLCRITSYSYLKVHFLMNYKKMLQSLLLKNSLTHATKIISPSSPLIHSFVKTRCSRLLQALTMGALLVIVMPRDPITVTVKSSVDSAPVGQM